MSIVSPAAASGASIALRLLTEAAPRPAGASAAAYPTVPGKAGEPVALPRTASPPDDPTRIVLSLAAAEAAFGAESFLMQTARGRADEVQVSLSTIPTDKDAFRARVLAFLGETMAADAGFMAALKAGQVVVNTVDEVPELNVQPMVSFTLHQNGYSTGSGTFSPPGTNLALYEALSATRGQSFGSLGNAQFYAWWPRAG